MIANWKGLVLKEFLCLSTTQSMHRTCEFVLSTVLNIPRKDHPQTLCIFWLISFCFRCCADVSGNGFTGQTPHWWIFSMCGLSSSLLAAPVCCWYSFSVVDKSKESMQQKEKTLWGHQVIEALCSTEWLNIWSRSAFECHRIPPPPWRQREYCGPQSRSDLSEVSQHVCDMWAWGLRSLSLHTGDDS